MTQRPASRLLVRVSAPASEPVTLSEAKLYLRIDTADEDSLLNNLIAAARMAAEDHLRKSLITQQWKLAFDDYAPENSALPRGPVQSVVSVKSIDRAGVETAIDSAAYTLNAAKNAVVFDGVVTGARVEIVYVAGYGNAAGDVPMAIRQGLLAHIATLYDGREQGAGMPAAAVVFYEPYREVCL